jgi:hypothetical protein
MISFLKLIMSEKSHCFISGCDKSSECAFFFLDNKKNGHGRYEGANGVYEGNYKDGKKSGVHSWPYSSTLIAA